MAESKRQLAETHKFYGNLPVQTKSYVGNPFASSFLSPDSMQVIGSMIRMLQAINKESAFLLVQSVKNDPKTISRIYLPKEMYSRGKSYFIEYLHGTDFTEKHTDHVFSRKLKFSDELRENGSHKLRELINAMDKISTKTVLKDIQVIKTQTLELGLLQIKMNTNAKDNHLTEQAVLSFSPILEQRIRNDEKKIHESEDHYRKLIQNMDEGVLLFDDQGLIVSANNAAKRILEIEDELLNKTADYFPNFINCESGLSFPKNELPHSIAIKSQQPVSNVIMGIRLKGKTKWVKTHAVPLDLGEQKRTFVLVTFSDISSLKHKNQQLEESNATKDKFISIMAHDLKSSFNVIMGYTELLKDASKRNDAEGIGTMASHAHNSAIQTLGLLENLLDWSRAQTGHLEFNPETIDLKQLLDDVMLMQNNLAEQKSVNIEVEIQHCKAIIADRNMMSTILRNVVSNAIKFTHHGGNIKVSCKKAESAWYLIIEDDGIGMDEAQVKNLFDSKSVRSKSGTKGESGTGLGLKVCKDFVDFHKGRISANSQPGKGTSIHIEIP